MAEPNTERAREIARASSNAMHEKDIAAQTLDMSVTEIGPGHATMKMTVTGDMLDASGHCDPGLIFSLADTAFAHECNSYNNVSLAIACTVEYTSTAQQGDKLLAVARERYRSGRTGIYDVDIFKNGNDTIAVFRGRSFSTGERLVADVEQGHG